MLQLENGARPNIKCDNGFFPINVAGKCGSAKTLEILIRHGKYTHKEFPFQICLFLYKNAKGKIKFF